MARVCVNYTVLMLIFEFKLATSQALNIILGTKHASHPMTSPALASKDHRKGDPYLLNSMAHL